MADNDNKKFLSNANDYIKSVLTYETLDNGKTRVCLNKMDNSNPIELINTGYWDRNIIFTDYEGTAHTVVLSTKEDDVYPDINFQLPNTIKNDVSGIVRNGEGYRILYSGLDENQQYEILNQINSISLSRYEGENNSYNFNITTNNCY